MSLFRHAREFSCVFVALLLFTASCGGAPEKPELVFAVGGAPTEIELWEKLLSEFEKKTGTHVSILRQPTNTDQRRQGLSLSLQAGEKNPDVFLMDVAWIAQFASSDWLEPIEAADESAFFAKTLDLADRYRGKLIALPVYVDAGLLYYRKDLLERFGFAVPVTWFELVDRSRRVQEAMRKEDPAFSGYVWQGAPYEGLICNFLEYAGSAGGGLKLEPAVELNTPANIEALTLMAAMIHDVKISPLNTFTEMKEEESRQFFQDGHALFERNWPYAYALHQGDGSAVKGKVGISVLPRFEGGASVSTLGGWHAGISKFSDAKPQALEFLRYITSAETQKRLAMELGWNPGRRDVYNDPEVLAKLPHLKHLAPVFENAVPRPNVPYYTQVSEVLQKSISAALAGTLSSEEALKEAEGEISKIVKRYGGGM